MKIEDLALFLPGAARPQNPAPGKENFAECLKEALSPAPRALGGPGPPAVLSAVGETAASAGSLVDGALSRLEVLAQGLARGDVSLKRLEPLVEALQEDSRRLHSLAQSLPPESPLRRVAEEAAALAWVEGFKFQRGDYL